MTYKIIHTNGTVSLEQKLLKDSTLFAVQYGHQRVEGLTYSEAAKEYGECVFHELACDSILDNR